MDTNDRATPDPRVPTLLLIALAARRVSDIAFVFQGRFVPKQALGELTPERADTISQDFHIAMQALLDSFCGVNLNDPETLRYTDDRAPERKHDA